MKKITYLVAPLMVMPFLLGCNKVKTHKVSDVIHMNLKFTQMNGKELDGSSFNEKQNFKFKVKAQQDPGSVGIEYTVDINGIGIYVGKDAVLPLLDGYTIEYTKEDKTEATVTILANKVVDDIYIRSIAHKEGNYVYDVAYMDGVHMPEGQQTIGWHAKSSDLTLPFKAQQGCTLPDAGCFMYSDDGENFYVSGDEWTTAHASVTQDGDTANLKITGMTTDYLLISARSKDSESFLDAYSWNEIKAISDQGYAPYLFNVGEKKHVTLKTAEGIEVEHTVRIIGFDHDNLNKPTETRAKAGITFQFETAISDAAGKAIGIQWNNERKAGNFENSDLNDALNGAAIEMLPEDLVNNLAYVTKKVGQYSSRQEAWGLMEYRTRLFPLSVEEMGGSIPSYCRYIEGEGTQYAYFSEGTNDRIIKGVDATPTTYWLRSPNNWEGWIQYATGVANYVEVNGNFGSQGAYVDSHTYAVAPAFCI